MINKFGFGGTIDASIDITLLDTKKKFMTAKMKNSSSAEMEVTKIPIYKGDEKISGKIDISSKKKFDHMGIKVELIGMIEYITEEAQSSIFMSNGIDLEPPSTQTEDRTYNFNFPVFQKPFESYYGTNVRLRYIIRVSISPSKYKSALIKSQDVGVLIDSSIDEVPRPIQIEVGIDDYLTIKIDLPKNIYELKETIEGKILFTMVKLVLKKMDLVIVRKEKLGVGDNAKIFSEEVCLFEIMDGSPIKGSFKRRRNSNQVIPQRFNRSYIEYDKH